jgi:hypothetical protein
VIIHICVIIGTAQIEMILLLGHATVLFLLQRLCIVEMYEEHERHIYVRISINSVVVSLRKKDHRNLIQDIRTTEARNRSPVLSNMELK